MDRNGAECRLIIGFLLSHRSRQAAADKKRKESSRAAALTKIFDTEGRAEHEAEKLSAEKLRKGYRNVAREA